MHVASLLTELAKALKAEGEVVGGYLHSIRLTTTHRANNYDRMHTDIKGIAKTLTAENASVGTE